ncbi:MAG: hypothetical protein ABW321_24060 [Polyangiales bacterium]
MDQQNPKRSLWRWLRLAAFVAVVVSVSAVWKVREVSASLSERSLAIGRQLESWRDPVAGTSTIRLNGQRVAITSVSTDDAVGPVLDRFTRMCARKSGGITEQIQALVAHGGDVPEHVSSRFGVFRTEKDANEGAAACFARDGEGGMAELAERAATLAETGDLAALGQLRYVFARRREGSSTTHVLTVVSDGALPLEVMFPAQGDAPGDDVVSGVRPARARRLISAELEGTAQRAVFYEAEVRPEVALRAYDEALPVRGFLRGQLEPAGADMPAPTRVYFKQDEILLLIASHAGKASSHLSAYRLKNGGFARMPL